MNNPRLPSTKKTRRKWKIIWKPTRHRRMDSLRRHQVGGRVDHHRGPQWSAHPHAEKLF